MRKKTRRWKKRPEKVVQLPKGSICLNSLPHNASVIMGNDGSESRLPR